MGAFCSYIRWTILCLFIHRGLVCPVCHCPFFKGYNHAEPYEVVVFKHPNSITYLLYIISIVLFLVFPTLVFSALLHPIGFLTCCLGHLWKLFYPWLTLKNGLLITVTKVVPMNLRTTATSELVNNHYSPCRQVSPGGITRLARKKSLHVVNSLSWRFITYIVLKALRVLP